MRFVLLWILCLLIVTMPCPLVAEEIHLGETSLTIPAPEGFALLTKDIQPLYDLAQRTVSSENVQFAMFIPAEELPSAREHQLTSLPRRASVQSAKAIIQHTVTNAEFDSLKESIKSLNDATMKQLNAELPKEIEKLNKDVLDTYHRKLGYSVAGIVPLPAHRNEERCLAYSMAMKGQINNAAGAAVPFENVATVSALHVRGKVLFLWVYAEKEGLQWSRELARHWSDAVLEANPSTGEIAALERGSWLSRLSNSLSPRDLMYLALASVIALIGILWRRAVRLRRRAL